MVYNLGGKHSWNHSTWKLSLHKNVCAILRGTNLQIYLLSNQPGSINITQASENSSRWILHTQIKQESYLHHGRFS